MTGWLSTLMVVAEVVVAAATGRPVTVVTKPRPQQPMLAGSVSNMSANPGSISFQANDPDAGGVSGNSDASVSWRASSFISGSWNLTVQAASASFQGCGTVPASAVRVTCSNAGVSGSGSGSCSGSFALSTSPQNVATGSEGTLNLNATYSVNLTFTLTDSWKYQAQLSPQCSLSLTYTANLN
jgi:hypothetical protein